MKNKIKFYSPQDKAGDILHMVEQLRGYFRFNVHTGTFSVTGEPDQLSLSQAGYRDGLRKKGWKFTD